MKYILITGATGGIGQAVINDLLCMDYGICAVGRSIEKLENVFGNNKNILFFESDLATEESVVYLVKEVVAKVGLLSGLVHCAGFDKLSPLYLNKRKDIEALFNIHTYAAMDLCKMMAKKGNAAEGCSIVLISSLAAHEGAKGHSAYAAAKGALEGFLAPAASELADKKIRLNIVVLGAIHTEMTMGYVSKMDEQQRKKFELSYPLGFVEPSQAVGVISFLISDKSYWLTGQKFIVDGGRMLNN